MDETRRITDPDLLTDITTGVSSLSISSDTQPTPTALVLLQPLGNPSTIAPWLPPMTFSRHQHRYLNLQPLGLQWRQAITKAPPIAHLIFDLSLPKPESHEEFQKVYWDSGVPNEGGIAVRIRDVMMLVITLATGTRMRVEGEVKFEVRYGEGKGIRENVIRSLEKQLAALEKEYRKIATVPDEGKIDHEGLEEGKVEEHEIVAVEP